MRKRRGYDSDLDSVFELKNFKGELINLPQQFNRDGVTYLGDNVAKFKEAMKMGQTIDDRQNEQKTNCVNNVKNLIKNYKSIVESQEQLLGKVILKAKEFRSSEMQALENRYNKGFDQDEIERAKRFLEEQGGYLDNKNRELEATRKAMQTTIRRVEQEREEFARRSQQAGEEMAKIKKQVEMLPALVEQELN